MPKYVTTSSHRESIRDLASAATACGACARLVWAKASLQVRLTAIAFNLRRSWRLLAGAPA